MSDKASKTEKPTAKRKREAVRDGQVPRSADVSSWLTVLSFSLLGAGMAGRLHDLFDRLMLSIHDVIVSPDPDRAMHVLKIAGMGTLTVMALPMLAAMGVAVLGGAMQGGLRISTKRFKPKFDKLNIGKGIKHMFGAQAAWGLVKTLLKFGTFGLVAFVVLRTSARHFTGSGAWSLSSAVGFAGSSALALVRLVAMIGLGIAALDYMVERKRVGKSLMMSPDEVKKEARQSEGDPHQKGFIRQRQREISRNMMISAVAAADVVVVNPTHVAVALAYENGRGAPRVVAKGSGNVAKRIREEAEKHRRPMVQDIPLARTIYKACEVGDEIPVELYDAVARVLAFVMALRRRGSSVAGFHKVPLLKAG
jgi:flagellar biosynthesis protein FlhB